MDGPDYYPVKVTGNCGHEITVFLTGVYRDVLCPTCGIKAPIEAEQIAAAEDVFNSASDEEAEGVNAGYAGKARVVRIPTRRTD